ncbi:ATP-binding protein [Sphingorhabdus sp. YGSMI21]|uniref:ATP-binding protein n=1 Tax=Sphingorhabdus sp. YGSMI21 TaxID=2077182 RepID=UPI000C1EFB4B|nr:ATP-binding protein [Sphingorhabdus sp. YGSMI21]ATW04877.1 sensor histidine kinase [Sphingorhabdus sp. YGSMI21]
MEPVIATPNKDGQECDRALSLRWSARLSLTTRILAVNVLAIALLAGGLFYLNNYRDRLTEERLVQARMQLTIVADALSAVDAEYKNALIRQFSSHLRARLRLYGPDGAKVIDSFALAKPSYEFVDPEKEPFRKDLARLLDRTIESLVFSAPIPKFTEPDEDLAGAWPELVAAKGETEAVSSVRLAPDRTPVIAAGKSLPDGTGTILLTANARDITRIVRAERSSVLLVILVAATVSILLSLFLARTIVQPIRKLAHAALRVRMGRSDEIAIPRMPDRRDEIGQLSRALSDMSSALRYRINATEAFAADVSHEIKNPLASLRSALEGLERVEDPALQKQLLDVANDDVQRIDRLINDISDASRVDAELARAKFEPIDIGKMLEQLLAAREQRASNLGVHIAFARPAKDVARVMGDGGRLERVFSNLLDNAVSFSPDGGLVEILATPDGEEIVIHVADQGPGVDPEQREQVFQRFHSDRPDSEAFGKHSGLGLAIAKTIIEGHQGTIRILDRPGGQSGACFEIRLPKSAA